MKADVKSKPIDGSVDTFLSNLDNEQKRLDCLVVMEMMKKATSEEPKLWGQGLIGFGLVHIVSKSGREVDWFRLGFAPRKANISLYLNSILLKDAENMANLGKCKTGEGCLYITKLSDVDLVVLEDLIVQSVRKDNGEY